MDAAGTRQVGYGEEAATRLPSRQVTGKAGITHTNTDDLEQAATWNRLSERKYL